MLLKFKCNQYVSMDYGRIFFKLSKKQPYSSSGLPSMRDYKNILLVAFCKKPY